MDVMNYADICSCSFNSQDKRLVFAVDKFWQYRVVLHLTDQQCGPEFDVVTNKEREMPISSGGFTLDDCCFVFWGDEKKLIFGGERWETGLRLKLTDAQCCDFAKTMEEVEEQFRVRRGT